MNFILKLHRCSVRRSSVFTEGGDSGRIAIIRGITAIHANDPIRIWVYEGTLASGVAGPIGVSNAASHLNRKAVACGSKPCPMVTWRVESLSGEPFTSASGQSIPVVGKIDPRKRAEAIVLTAPFFSNMDDLIGWREQLHALSSALRR
ncbi:type 1 glutamine amidotransferase family protein [Paraburkholderia xenovorans]|uniref:hypothetical protein n=1 Tax=Paraburkholderia xenovorans TaxID=36873 RepID=UPI0038BAC319